MLIKDSTVPKIKRGLEVRRLFYRSLIPIDLKIYTSFEFNEELANQYTFLSSAIKESKLLYERKD